MSALRVLGLSAQQEDVYLALIDGPAVTLAELASRLPGHLADRLKQTVAELAKKELVTWVDGERLAPVAPDMALGPLILRCEEALSRSRGAAADLMQLFHQAQSRPGPDEPVEVVAGPGALRDMLAWLHRRAVREVRVLDVPPYVEEPHADAAERGLLARGVTYRIVYDDAALLVPDRLDHLGAMAGLGERARVAAGLPTKLLLVDDSYGLAPLRDGAEADSAVLVRPSVLLTALTTLFELLWSQAVPVTFDAVALPPGKASARAEGSARSAARATGSTGAKRNSQATKAAGATEAPGAAETARAAGLPEGGRLLASMEEPAEAVEPEPVEPTAEQRRLLELLVAGIADERIATVLGVSMRTLHRRINAVMDMLGVATRFQLGAEARLRGWL